MKRNLWDNCQLNAKSSALVEELSDLFSTSTKSPEPISASIDKALAAEISSQLSEIHSFQHVLSSADKKGREVLEQLDSLIQAVHSVRSSYEEVAARTNSLMSKCESLLDQQHTLQGTVEILQKTIQPFDDIEHIAASLGIPHDVPKSNGYSFQGDGEFSSSNWDPRSPEFSDMLQKLSTALHFVREHPEIYEAEKYRTWLDRLHTRAMSLVGRAMRDLLDNAAKRCREIIQQKSLTRGESKLLEEQPIESLPIYQKFRGLSYRMKELVAVLHSSGVDRSSGGDNSQYSMSPRPLSSSAGGIKGPEQGVLLEVKQAYSVLRVELLLPFIKEAWISSLALARSQSTVPSSLGSGTNLASIVEESKGMRPQPTSQSTAVATTMTTAQQYLSLSVALRHVYTTLIRVAQLEHQLFESLFQQDMKGGSNGSTIASPRPVTINNGNGYSLQKVSSFRNNDSGSSTDQAAISELIEVVENVANATRDFLRPLIIKESSVDELCRVISVLSEDMQAQITVLPVPASLIKMLLSSLDITVNDAKERGTYCAETKLRQHVQLFIPSPRQLEYPEILESYEEKRKNENNNGQGQAQGHSQQQEVYLTWYPPMRQTLSLLSKLYQVVAPPVFEDFARRSIEMCIDSLRIGADGVRRRGVSIHGDLFLVRHLMILREQLVPFEIRLQSTEKQLDFTSTGQALTDFMQFSRNMLRFDQTNGFLRFAQQGMPGMHELQTDAKKELDTALRKACSAFKEGTTKMFAAPLDGMLAKVAAFLGSEIPYESLVNDDRDATANDDNSNNNDPSPSNGGGGPQKGLKRHSSTKVPTLAPEVKNTLKGQSFVRPERIKECLEQVQHLIMQRLPDIKEMIKMYVDNPAARCILQKSIVQEFEISKRKMECVLMNCVDPGQAQREIDQLLQSIGKTIASELNT